MLLVVAGCSSDDSGDSGGSGTSGGSGGGAASSPAPSKTASPSPTVATAKYAELPNACKTLAAKTVEDLVPDVKKKGGTPGQSSDLASRASCSWNGLDDNGVKGSVYRWIDVSLVRFKSEPSLGSGEQRAQQKYPAKVAEVKAADGAKNVAATAGQGIGNESTIVTYELKRDDATFRYAVVVVRTENVLVTVSYNGAGHQGAKSPSVEDVRKGAERAAKEAVAAVAAANK